MAPDDDERGIDWLASQLGEPDGATADDGEVDENVDAPSPTVDQADAPAPAPRFGRRARRAAEPVAEPVAAPQEEAVPAGPAPWWTTPLPQPVETSGLEESTDDVDAAVVDTAAASAAASAAEPTAVVPTAVVSTAEPLPVEPVTVVRVDPALIEPPPVDPVDPAMPTALLASSDEAATTLLPVSPTGSDQPTQLLPAPAPARTADAGTEPANAEPASPEPASPEPASTKAAKTEAPHRHESRRGAPGGAQAALIWTAVGLLAVIVLVGLFYVGQSLVPSPVAAPQPTASVSPTPSPTPTPTPEVTGMQPAGAHEWSTLFGGECLEPYTSPWAEDFTVVDCAAAHTAQLVYRGDFGGEAAAAFPGEAALAAQINLVCTAPGILDLGAAGTYPNLQLQGSYPVTAEQWTTEPRTYYCFVSRASAEPLTGSIMGAGPGV